MQLLGDLKDFFRSKHQSAIRLFEDLSIGTKHGMQQALRRLNIHILGAILFNIMIASVKRRTCVRLLYLIDSQ